MPVNPKHLKDWIDDHERDLLSLKKEREAIDEKIAKVEQMVSHLKALLSLETGNGRQLPLVQGRFKGVSLRNAALTVIREQQEADLEDLANLLVAGGFEFDGRNPNRTTFLTLCNLATMKDGRAPVKRRGTHFTYLEGGEA